MCVAHRDVSNPSSSSTYWDQCAGKLPPKVDTEIAIVNKVMCQEETTE